VVFSINVVKAPIATKYVIKKDVTVEVPFEFKEDPACGLSYTLDPAVAFI
jgi:hypothetical protein